MNSITVIEAQTGVGGHSVRVHNVKMGKVEVKRYLDGFNNPQPGDMVVFHRIDVYADIGEADPDPVAVMWDGPRHGWIPINGVVLELEN